MAGKNENNKLEQTGNQIAGSRMCRHMKEKGWDYSFHVDNIVTKTASVTDLVLEFEKKNAPLGSTLKISVPYNNGDFEKVCGLLVNTGKIRYLFNPDKTLKDFSRSIVEGKPYDLSTSVHYKFYAHMSVNFSDRQLNHMLDMPFQEYAATVPDAVKDIGNEFIRVGEYFQLELNRNLTDVYRRETGERDCVFKTNKGYYICFDYDKNKNMDPVDFLGPYLACPDGCHPNVKTYKEVILANDPTAVHIGHELEPELKTKVTGLQQTIKKEDGKKKDNTNERNSDGIPKEFASNGKKLYTPTIH